MSIRMPRRVSGRSRPASGITGTPGRCPRHPAGTGNREKFAKHLSASFSESLSARARWILWLTGLSSSLSARQVFWCSISAQARCSRFNSPHGELGVDVRQIRHRVVEDLQQGRIFTAQVQPAFPHVLQDGGRVFVRRADVVHLHPSAPMMLVTSTAWWAVRARPDSLMMVGCGRSNSRHTSPMPHTTLLAYSERL